MIQGNRRKAFYVGSEIFFCVEGPILAIKPGRNWLAIDLTPFRIKPSLTKAHQFAALGQEVVIVVLQVVSLFRSVCCCCSWFLFFKLSCQRKNCVSVCVYLYIRKYTIYVHIQNLEFHYSKKKMLPFLWNTYIWTSLTLNSAF